MPEEVTGAAPVPDADDVNAVTTAVLTASRLLVAVSARSLAAVQEHVTLPQFRMLVVLAGGGEMKLVALAERLAVHPSTAMRMVDRLVASGLVDRHTNPANRRENVLRPTTAGRRIVDDVTARRRAEIAEIVARMPASRRRGMVAALRAFTAAGDEPPAADPIPLGWD
jgi:DNA-binding MarR family transcriptional regulator